MINKLDKTVSALTKVEPLITKIYLVAGISLLAMVFFTFVDVFLRYLFSRPIRGGVDLVELMLIILVYFGGIAYTQVRKRHVNIDLVTSRLSPKARLLTYVIVYFFSVGIVGFLVWQSVIVGLSFLEEGRGSLAIAVPLFYFTVIMAFGFALLEIVVIRDFLSYLVEGLKLNIGVQQWLLALGISILLAAGTALFVLGFFNVSPFTAGLISVVVLILLFFTEIPIAFALGFVGIIFLIFLSSPTAAFDTIGRIMYNTVANYSFAAIPTFVLMGFFCFYAEFGRDLYHVAHEWLGREPGGLAMGTVAASSGLAAVVGDTLSATITMGVVALPEMKRYKYDDKLACGSIIAGGTIGTLIPPSIPFIIYGLLTETSIGDLFIAGIFPGLLCAGLFMLYIDLMCRRNLALGPRGPMTSWRNRLLALQRAWPIAALIILVLGGIYTGIFTPTEAGAIGAVGALALGLIMRRFTKRTFIEAVREAGLTASILFLLLATAMIFSTVLALSGVPHMMSEYLIASGLPNVVILIGVILVLLFLGCIMPVMPVLLLTIPLFYPVIVTALGYDAIWFGVIMVLLHNEGAMTPPFGMNLFVLKGVAKDVSMQTIFLAALPFIALALIAVALIVVFPDIATWLPESLRVYKGLTP